MFLTIWKNWLKRGEGMRIRRKWALLALLAAAVLLGAGIFGVIQYRRATWRYPYSPETRRPSSSSGDMLMYFPSMETNLRLTDSVVRGTVISDGVESDIEGFYGLEYTVKVTEQIMGMPTDSIVTICCWGGEDYGMVKPHKNDDLILMLNYKEPYDVYTITCEAESMFAIMPGDFLYSFSMMDEFSALDGEPPEDVYLAILEAAQNIRSNPEEYEDPPIGGKVLDALLNPENDALAPLESIVESAS